MVEAIVGQKGRAVVKMFDADGNETDSYDEVTGISYVSDDENIVAITNTDAEPKDAELEARAAGGPVKVRCTFDGNPGDGVRTIELVSEDITVIENPDEGAVTGTFDVAFTVAEPPPPEE